MNTTTQPSTSQSKRSVQGSALLFSIVNNLTNDLAVNLLKDRSIRPNEATNQFLENTNLHKLNRQCFGTLIAYSFDDKRSKHESKQWYLGILLLLHPMNTIIAKCKFEEKVPKNNSNTIYSLETPLVQFVCFKQNDGLCIKYLNRISNRSIQSSDGFIESSISGPDIPFRFSDLPPNVKSELSQLKKKVAIDPLYSMSQKKTQLLYRKHIWRSKSKMNDATKKWFSKTNHLNLRGARTVNVKKSHAVKKKGYAFVYIESIPNPSCIRIYYLNHSNASDLLQKGSLSVEQYNAYLTLFSLDNKVVDVEYVENNGLILQETIPDNPDNPDKPKFHQFTYQQEALRHCLWIPCDIVEIPHPELFEYTLHKTYREFGFNRVSTPCFGLNAYIGKKNAEYVRPSPKMSTENTGKSEYYRSTFDSTFLPLIYKMLNELSIKCESFQISADPIYDKFLLLCFDQLKTQTGTNNNDLTKGRFAGLIVLTCGNSKCRGFANITHIDCDFLNKAFQDTADQLLNELQEVTGEVESLKKIHKHLSRIRSYGKGFFTYSTIGYKVLFKDSSSSQNKFVVAYFLYNSIQKAVKIPVTFSCYQMFAASMGEHQTTVPMTVCDGIVTFNDKDLLIFAFGNGKPRKFANGFFH